jgi:RNA polymerase sigma factor (sigma-70 family)
MVSYAQSPKDIEESALSLDEWLVRVRPRILAFAKKVTRPDLDPEDVVQQTLANCLRKGMICHKERKPWTMNLIQAELRHTVMSMGRAAGRRQKRELIFGEEIEQSFFFPFDQDTPYIKRVIADAIGKLPPVQAEVLEMRYFENLTLDKIARFRGVSINTIASRLRYALSKLRSDPAILELTSHLA